MLRKIVEIDQEKCNGCGACASACQEGAIAMVDGKARLVRDDYCDGLGNCLPACPADAITIVEREAGAYDEQAVKARQAAGAAGEDAAHSCPGSRAHAIAHGPAGGCPGNRAAAIAHADAEVPAPAGERDWPSRLSQWPVQIKLAPVRAPYFDGARLLIAADCTAYAYASFHERFIKGRITLVGCPKLDGVDYAEKLTEILRANDIRDVTIVRMEVPCCGGLEYAAKTALQNSGKFLPWRVVTISTDGRILDD